MCAARQGADRYAGSNFDIDLIGIFRQTAFRHIGRSGPFFPVAAVIQDRADIAGTDNGRENELIGSVGRHDQFRIMQFNADFVTRHDIGNVHRENIRPLLGHHGSGLSFAFCRFKFFLGLFLFLNGCGHALVADLHLHSMYGDFGGCRENIAGIDGARPLVGVGLCNISIRDDTIYGRVDGCFFQRETVYPDFFAFYIKIGRACLVFFFFLRFFRVYNGGTAKKHTYCKKKA